VVAPTLIADEMHPGELRPFVDPLLPPATTVAIPVDRRLSMIDFVGSPSQTDVDRPPPMLRFADERFRVPRTAYTRSSPAMMSEVQASTQGAEPPQSVALVNLEKTWTAMICAPFATPEKATPAPPPLPAAMPATCVPCQQLLVMGQLTPAPGPVCWLRPLGHTVLLRPVTVLE
jgi:hypothetical protein